MILSIRCNSRDVPAAMFLFPVLFPVKNENVSHQEIDNLLFPSGRGAYYGGCTSVLLLHVENESYLKRSEKKQGLPNEK